MHPKSTLSKVTNLSDINIVKEITRSDASSLFEVDMNGEKYALKVFHDNGDPGHARNGRDLNRFRCEPNAYEKLLASGVCDSGFVPKFYGCLDELDPAAFSPALRGFAHDKFKPKGILLEYLPNSEDLNCVNFSDTLFPQAIEGMQAIHRAGIHHQDTYPRNILLVRGSPDKLVWIDFDVATTFNDPGPEQQARCDHEIRLLEGLRELLVSLRPSLSMLKGLVY
ncbi:hypothetical protein N7456_005171 [Penicillium angulare]|uniref:Protein kinase domain-containing protein n=1 Tax=Penicillium angulare TaxID=116970 RepID=A0A9W9KJW7_9EURO|nr:hypothetical protein N7456_005171 [Penicillium angulare]